MFNLVVPKLFVSGSFLLVTPMNPPKTHFAKLCPQSFFSAIKWRNLGFWFLFVQKSSSCWPFCSGRALKNEYVLVSMWVPSTPWRGTLSQKQCCLIYLFHPHYSSIQSIAIYFKYFWLCPWKTALPGAIPSCQRDVLIKL